jgi:RNA polymerase sigma factor (sigma-70 family)
VLRVTTNLAIDATRRRLPQLMTPAPRVLDDEVATRLALAHALRALPARQRNVVVLRYLADMSESETADLLGIAPGTVKAHLHRALKRLREQLNVNLPEVGHATEL